MKNEIVMQVLSKKKRESGKRMNCLGKDFNFEGEGTVADDDELSGDVELREVVFMGVKASELALLREVVFKRVLEVKWA